MAANNFTVQFYDQLALFGNVTVETLNFGRNTTVNATFNATRNFHSIFVVVDYARAELSKSNNNATNNLTLLLSEINSPLNDSWTKSPIKQSISAFMIFTNSTLNFTVYSNGIFNRTANITDNSSGVAELNLSEGINLVVVEANGRIDIQGKDSGLFQEEKQHNALHKC